MISPGYTSQDKLWLLAEESCDELSYVSSSISKCLFWGAPMSPDITSLELATAVNNASGLGIISFGG
jgi:hypothetical protein